MTDEINETEDTEVADRLRAGRPRMRAARVRELRSRLLTLPQLPARPARLWLLVLGFAVSGLALLALAAAQI